MTTKPIQPRESEMLKRVRRWREEAYQADRKRAPHERAERTAELLREFGLQRRAPNRMERRRQA